VKVAHGALQIALALLERAGVRETAMAAATYILWVGAGAMAVAGSVWAVAGAVAPFRMLVPSVLQAGGPGLLDGLAVEVLMADTAAAELGLVGDIVMLLFRFCHGPPLARCRPRAASPPD
jgi:hypothetical protein